MDKNLDMIIKDTAHQTYSSYYYQIAANCQQFGTKPRTPPLLEITHDAVHSSPIRLF